MSGVTVGIMAYDPHELLCHRLALARGFYADEGLDPILRDVSMTPPEQLPRRDYVQVACGAAYAGRRAGAPFVVVLAAVHRPLFWLVAAGNVRELDDLAGKQVGGYPPDAPPQLLLQAVLHHRGIQAECLPMREDRIRLGLLSEGSIDAAVLSSAISPAEIDRRGLQLMDSIGSSQRFVSSGLATFEETMAGQPELVAAVVRAHRRALRLVHRDPSAVADVLTELTGVPSEEASADAERIRPAFTESGSVEAAEAQTWIDQVEAARTEPCRVDASKLFDFRMLADSLHSE